MKKTYIQPSTLVMNVAMQQMICTSGFTMGISKDSNDAIDAGVVESRSSSAWDDDDDY